MGISFHAFMECQMRVRDGIEGPVIALVDMKLPGNEPVPSVFGDEKADRNAPMYHLLLHNDGSPKPCFKTASAVMKGISLSI